MEYMWAGEGEPGLLPGLNTEEPCVQRDQALMMEEEERNAGEAALTRTVVAAWAAEVELDWLWRSYSYFPEKEAAVRMKTSHWVLRVKERKVTSSL